MDKNSNSNIVNKNKINGSPALYLLISKTSALQPYIVLFGLLSQSGRLYESIYHIGSYAKMNPNMDKINNNYAYPSQQRFNSRAFQDPPKERYNHENSYNDPPRQSDRYMQDYVQAEMRQPNSSLNNYESSRYGSIEKRQPSYPNPK